VDTDFEKPQTGNRTELSVSHHHEKLFPKERASRYAPATNAKPFDEPLSTDRQCKEKPSRLLAKSRLRILIYFFTSL
jgi:hypothetical protein